MGQSIALYEHLTARENLLFFGQLKGLDKTILQTEITEKLALIQLTAFAEKRVQTFSGGMKRRLSLAITLLGDPAFLVLDEPTASIDPLLRVTIWEKLQQLAQNGTTILVTTHIMDEAEKCDQVGLLVAGTLFARGTPSSLKQQFQVQTIEEVFLKAEVSRDAL